MSTLHKIIFFLLFTSTVYAADPPMTLYDEGVKQGVIFRLDCSGTGIACTKSGITGTISSSGGGTGTINSGVGNSVPHYSGTGTTLDDASGSLWDTGNVGVGTSVPQAQFAVGTTSQLQVNSTGVLTATNAALTTPNIGVAQGTSLGLTGNLGIGTTTISGGALTVLGTGAINGVTQQWRNNANTANVTFIDSGNVGIGSTFPSSMFSVGSTGNLSVSSAGIITKINNAASTISNTGWNTSVAGSLNFLNGSSNSAAKMTIVGGDNAISNIELQATSGTGVGAEFIRMTGGTSGGTEWLRVRGGNVGIGSSIPQSRLVVQGTGTTTSRNVQIQDSSAAVKITVLDNGNIGVGSTLPGGKFVVTGAVAQAGQATCWGTNGSIGYCSSIVGAGGGCTCTEF